MPSFYELYLIRHGIAEQRGDEWPDDSKRPLSATGAQRVRKSAGGLARLGVTFDVILTSPATRTSQTAELFAKAMNPTPEVVKCQALAPDGSVAAVLAALSKHARWPRLALVGHDPGIGMLAARLLGTRQSIEFKKGAVCRIDLDVLPPTRPGALRWLATPRLLRAISK